MQFHPQFLLLIFLSPFFNPIVFLRVFRYLIYFSIACFSLQYFFLFSRNNCFQTKQAALVLCFDWFAFLGQESRLSKPTVPTHLNIYNSMDRQNKNNRSLLAMAGENSLASSNSKRSYQPYTSNYKHVDKEISKFPTSLQLQPSQSNLFDPKAILKKLGLARLRKMQALVRGFIVRRTIYPKELTKYLIAKSAMELIVANVIYRQVSGIVVQAVTLGHYDQSEGGEDRMLQEYLYNAIIKRVIQQQFLPIARQAVYQTAIYASRPQITFGFNMRDPLELILFMKINSLIQTQSKQIAEQALRQQALQRRQLQIIDDLIRGMQAIPVLCSQIVNQCLLEGVQEYVLQEIINKVSKEGAMVIGEVVYNQKIAEVQDMHVNQLVQQAEQWLLQQCILSLIVGKPSSNRILPSNLQPDTVNQ